MRREESSSHIKPLGFCFHKSVSSGLHFWYVSIRDLGNCVVLVDIQPWGWPGGWGAEKLVLSAYSPSCSLGCFQWELTSMASTFFWISVFYISLCSPWKCVAVTWRKSLRQTPLKPSRCPLWSALNNQGLNSSQNWKTRGVVGFRVGSIQQVNRIIQGSVSPSLPSLPFAVLASYQSWLPS